MAHHGAVAYSLAMAPQPLYAWDVGYASAPSRGQGGVTDDRETAVGHVHEGLKDLPAGATGKIREVYPDPQGEGAYIETGRVSYAWQTGSGVWWAR